MKKIFIYITLALAYINTSVAEGSAYKEIERIQVRGGQGAGISADYHFHNAAGWGADGCPSAEYAYLNADDSGAKEMFTLAIAAKAQGSMVKFLGTCQEDKNYFNVYYIYYK